MKFVLSIFVLLLLSCKSIYGQDIHLSAGIELGLMQNWTKITKDETGVFINNQDLSYNIHENYKRIFVQYTNKLSYKLDYTKALYTDYICTQDNLGVEIKGKECGGTQWNAHQINFNVGRQFKVHKWLYAQPNVGLGFVFFEDFEVGYFGEGGSGGFPWNYEEMSTSFRDNNYNLNAGAEIIVKLNPILKLKLMYTFQQALFKIYKSEIVAWQPENPDIFIQPTDPSKLKYATVEANGSNTQFGFGLEFLIHKFTKKK